MNNPREHDLLQQIAEKDAQISRQQDELEAARRKIELLERKVDELACRLFGKSSEKLDPNQLQILFQELQTPGPAEGKELGPEAIETAAPRPKETQPTRKRKSRPRLPEHLPVIEELVVPLEVQAQPEAYRKIGEEVTERLDYQPARFQRLRTVRVKYVKQADPDAVPVIAPLPPCILEGSILTPGLMAQVLVAKYADHLPLYRQEQIYSTRHGVNLSRQLMSQWVDVAADWLRPIYDEIKSGLTSGNYIQVDETPVRYLKPGHGETKKGWLWVMHRPGSDVVFWWSTGRGANRLAEFIPETYTGWVQCDGWQAYDRFAGNRPAGQIQLAACWAHARRYFRKAVANAPRQAGLIIHLMQVLYGIERELKRKKADSHRRRWIRSHHSRSIIERIHKVLKHWETTQKFTPESAMGKAIQYALNQWEWLLPYLENGHLEIDSNLVENAIRPTAIGKKNWLFFGDEGAGQKSAVIYTLVESCRRRGIDPYEYLRDIFTKLPTATNWQIKELTPEAWQKSRQPVREKAAA